MDTFINVVLLMLNVWAAVSLYELLIKPKNKRGSPSNDNKSASVESQGQLREKATDAEAQAIVAMAKAHGWRFKPGDSFKVLKNPLSENHKNLIRNYYVNGDTRGPLIANHLATDFKLKKLAVIQIERKENGTIPNQQIIFGLELAELEATYRGFFDTFSDAQKASF